jgi:hypothetical protein
MPVKTFYERLSAQERTAVDWQASENVNLDLVLGSSDEGAARLGSLVAKEAERIAANPNSVSNAVSEHKNS